MKIVKRTLLLVLFVCGVFLATHNSQDVTLVVIPALGIAGWPAEQTIDLPLFVVILAALTAGGLLIGVVAAAERISLQTRLRRARKDVARLESERSAIREKLELTSSELEQAQRDAAERDAREHSKAGDDVGDRDNDEPAAEISAETSAETPSQRLP
jgi:uncharacterized integral membrane protein